MRRRADQLSGAAQGPVGSFTRQSIYARIERASAAASAPAGRRARSVAAAVSSASPSLSGAAPDLALRPAGADAAAEARSIRAYIDCRVKDPTSPCAAPES